jgi:hypothetical protein
MGRVYLDVAREGGRTAKLARLGAPALTWDQFDALMASGLSPSRYPSDKLVFAGKEGRHETNAVQ